MKQITKYLVASMSLIMLIGLSGCSLVVGTEEWCDKMMEKSAGDWTTNEALDVAKHCIVK